MTPVLRTMLAPFTAVGRRLARLLRRLAGRPMEESPALDLGAEIRSVVPEGELPDRLEEGEKEMIQSIFELHDVDASEIMTPRTEMECIEADAPLERVAALAVRSGYSRIPLFESTRDNIVGIVHVKDILRPLLEGPQRGAAVPQRRAARDVAQPPYFVPESKRVHELLDELRRAQGHMAIVLDEYGGTAGLVTLEDVLEEIVGEIEDEHDEEPAEPLRAIDGHTLECEASLPLDDLEEALGIHLPEDPGYDTVGGFVSAQLGHIPAKGEACTWANVHFTVLDATERKIRRLRVAVQPPEAVAEED